MYNDVSEEHAAFFFRVPDGGSMILLNTGTQPVSTRCNSTEYHNLKDNISFSIEDGDSMFLRNVGIYLRFYTAPKPRRTSPSSSYSREKPQISQDYYCFFYIKYTSETLRLYKSGA
jgi:hypothetical protein